MNRRTFIKKSAAAVSLLAAAESFSYAEAGKTDNPELLFLRRSSYGVEYEEYLKIKKIGIKSYLKEQLEHESIVDKHCDKKLEAFSLLNLDRKTIYGLNNSDTRSYKALLESYLVRKVFSKKQLYEKMVEFWSDHFNIPAETAPEDYAIFQRDIIQKHALGSFKKMLFATAKSPAMLNYLDNAENVAEHPNENYARELLELHSLGVDGGYTEKDVREVARAFTGWTTDNATEDGFFFESYNHDDKEKHVLGHVLAKNRGIEDGLQVLSIVANHPNTAKFIAFKLCRRFVSDNPPESLVNRLAEVFMKEKTEIKPVLEELFGSPEFFASAGQKYRRPLEYFIAGIRATETEIYDFWTTTETLSALDQIPYGWFPPDGYPDVAEKWISTSDLLNRWNFANTITHLSSSTDSYGLSGNLFANHPNIEQLKNVKELVEEISKKVFGVVLSSNELEPFIEYASDSAGAKERVNKFLIARKLDGIYALMLSSKEFQWT